MVLNPSELLKKARDSQRISDLATLKKAIAIYQTDSSSINMAGANNTGCKGTTSNSNWQTSSDKIYYSYPSDTGAPITATSFDGVVFTGGAGPSQVVQANLGKTDSTGWLPINFSSIPGEGSPISQVPIDPVNTIANPSYPTNTDLVYRYVCSENTLQYEIDAVLESDAYAVTDNKMAQDGGNNDSYYESGTDLNIFSIESFPSGACGTYTVKGAGGLTYGTVVGEDGKCWLDRNLGATRVAIAYNDTSSYGYLYQWGRGGDGHQIRTSGTTSVLSTSNSPGHNNFIKSPNTPYDWRTPQNNSLWQGVSGINNPCPSGFRIPTNTEWQTLATAIGGFTTATCGGSSTCRDVAFGSTLKLPSGGYRDSSSAGLNILGSYGCYWSSSVNGIYAYYLDFNSAAVSPAGANSRALGFSARCIKDF